MSAALVLGLQEDPTANCLREDETFDVPVFAVLRDHMAAHWRHRRFPAAGVRRAKPG